MTQLDEAISRYTRILESEPYRDLRWVKNLQDQMEAKQLSAGGRLSLPLSAAEFRYPEAIRQSGQNRQALIGCRSILRLALAPATAVPHAALPAEKMRLRSTGFDQIVVLLLGNEIRPQKGAEKPATSRELLGFHLIL